MALVPNLLHFYDLRHALTLNVCTYLKTHLSHVYQRMTQFCFIFLELTHVWVWKHIHFFDICDCEHFKTCDFAHLTCVEHVLNTCYDCQICSFDCCHETHTYSFDCFSHLPLSLFLSKMILRILPI